MKGLILKDLFVLKSQIRFYLIFILLYGFIALYSGNTSFLSGLICMFCLMLPLTAIAYDERAGWEKYALSMPVNRRDLVLSKYILGILFNFMSFLISVIFGMFTSTPIKETLIVAAAFVLIALIYLSLVLPMTFKLGTEKSRIYMLAIVLSPIIGLILLDKFGFSFSSVSDIPWKTLFPLFVAAVILFFFASIALSISIYKKKEF